MKGTETVILSLALAKYRRIVNRNEFLDTSIRHEACSELDEEFLLSVTSDYVLLN